MAVSKSLAKFITASELNVALINTGVLTSTAATIDIQNIPANYRHLKLVFSGRGAVSAGEVQIILRCNNDSTAGNYLGQGLLIANASSFPGPNAGSVASIVGNGTAFVPAATGLASSFGDLVTLIKDYANTSKLKSATSVGGASVSSAAAGQYTYHVTGTWRSTSAINRLTILPSSGDWEIGTSWSLYGII